jgi:hypothetical protein
LKQLAAAGLISLTWEADESIFAEKSPSILKNLLLFLWGQNSGLIFIHAA